MFIFSIIALLMLAAVIAYKNKCDITLSLPVVTGGLILVLYILAFAGALKYIDVIAIVVIIVSVVWMKLGKKSEASSVTDGTAGNAECGKVIHELVATPVNLVIVIALVLLTLSQLAVKASWWDDLNFWATDAKAIYMLGGFPGKYGNVAPEFGDYPPTLSLFKWFFMHFSSTYIEGLGYSAYQCLNFILIIPVLHGMGRGKWKCLPLYIAGCGIIYYLPSVCNIVGYEGACADVTMALLYGNLLWFIWKLADYYKGGKCEVTPSILRAGITVFSSVLVLTKSVGVEWVAYAFVFFLIVTRKVPKSEIKRLIAVWALPVICEGSWLGFCLMNRRVAKLTSSGVHMATGGNMDLKGYAAEKAQYFIKGFLFEPIHTGHAGLLNLSAAVYLVVLIAVICVMAKISFINRKEAISLIIYTVITALLAYGIIFIGHITIFAAETQYASSEVMAISMSRYAAPFTLGMLILMVNILIDRTQKTNMIYGVIAAFVLITCEYVTPFNALYNYRLSLGDVENTRAEMTKEARGFIDTVDASELWGQRVLYLRDDHKAQWVSSAYINLECAPVAVVYGGIANDTMTRDDMEYILSSSHATYVYSDEVDGDATALFEGIINGDFEYNRLYRYENGLLMPVE